jgi:hypothetical protein
MTSESEPPQVASERNDAEAPFASSRAGSGLRDEFLRLWLAARLGWANGARPWLGGALALSSVAVSLLVRFEVWRPELWRSGDVYAALPLTTELIRLPMSLFMPTAYLPLWGAVLQLLVVIGLGELILGRSMTVLVAAIGHAGATLVARVVLATPHLHVLGLTPAVARLIDTGPSGATTAVGACLLVAMRMNRSTVLLGVGLLIASLVAPGLDGLEHGVALVTGLGAGAGARLIYPHASLRSWAQSFRDAKRGRLRPRHRPALSVMRSRC